jgi:quinol monooxygenase YgiN
MRSLGRRGFLALALTAPLLLPESAAAAIKMPTKVPPPRVLPLGVWRMSNVRPTAERGAGPTLVELSFRSAVDVAAPRVNWWPRRLPLTPLPLPPTPSPNTIYRPTPIPIGSERRPEDEALGEPLTGGLVQPVFVEVDVAQVTCPGGYRINCEMIDPETPGYPTGRRHPGPEAAVGASETPWYHRGVTELVLIRPVHFPPGREEIGLAWLRDAMAARREAGMTYHAIVRSRTDPSDYLALMVWPDQATYDRWNASDARARLFADQPHYLVREPTRRYTCLGPNEAVSR